MSIVPKTDTQFDNEKKLNISLTSVDLAQFTMATDEIKLFRREPNSSVNSKVLTVKYDSSGEGKWFLVLEASGRKVNTFWHENEMQMFRLMIPNMIDICEGFNKF